MLLSGNSKDFVASSELIWKPKEFSFPCRTELPVVVGVIMACCVSYRRVRLSGSSTPKSDTRKAGGLMSGAASKAVALFLKSSR